MNVTQIFAEIMRDYQVKRFSAPTVSGGIIIPSSSTNITVRMSTPQSIKDEVIIKKYGAQINSMLTTWSNVKLNIVADKIQGDQVIFYDENYEVLSRKIWLYDNDDFNTPVYKYVWSRKE